jgi:hypothetical protein
MTVCARGGIVDAHDGGDGPWFDGEDRRDDWDYGGQNPGEAFEGISMCVSGPEGGKHGAGGELAVNLFCELVVGSLLWAAIIAGLISVVRDCLRDRSLTSIFPEYEEQECQHCCGWGSVEILPQQRQDP